MASIISIHAPARGATPPGYTECTTTGNFNPRSREGSDVIQFVLQAEFIKFQSTLPRGERLPLDSVCFKYLLFQSTLPRGERQKLQYISTRTIAIFQSTLPRGERLETQKTSGSQSEISIHAPARGATSTGLRLLQVSPISIHAPARGATYSPHEIKERLQINFNPRSARGATSVARDLTNDEQISIHAPARGATATASVGFARFVNFNPRSREGSDCEAL